MNKNDVKFAAVYNKAVQAGMAAGNGANPIPMVVGTPTSFMGHQIDYSKPTHYVADGVCGFAWVTIRPGGCSFARWLAKSGKARTAYGGGMQIWVSAFGQSLQRKEACAAAMAKVISNELGINAYSGSRMD